MNTLIAILFLATCPMHAEHMAAVDARHDTFGMSHAATTHSFRLFADGGAIELRGNDPKDAATIDAIRTHLQDVGSQFKKADFHTPAFVHGHAPDGVSEMQRLREFIEFRYEPVTSGGRIRITTKNADALAAVHDFLKFQVVEHRTANAGTVEEDK